MCGSELRKIDTKTRRQINRCAFQDRVSKYSCSKSETVWPTYVCSSQICLISCQYGRILAKLVALCWHDNGVVVLLGGGGEVTRHRAEPKVGQIGPIREKSGNFSDKDFRTFCLVEPKCTNILWSTKISDLSNFGEFGPLLAQICDDWDMSLTHVTFHWVNTLDDDAWCLTVYINMSHYQLNLLI